MSKWVVDEIKDDYKAWKPGQKIFISSQTGTGKTTFILDKLLPYYAEEQGRKILILVNRRILRDQLKDILIHYDNSDYISVRTYQSLEKEVCDYCDREIFREPYLLIPDGRTFNDRKKYEEYIRECVEKYYSSQTNSYIQYVINRFREYDCVVCDECHYFLMDSNFNTNTCLSYRLIQKAFYDKVQIYMSATIEPIKKYIMDENPLREESTYLYGFKIAMPIQNRLYWHYAGITAADYNVEKDYSYVSVGILTGKHGLIDAIKKQPNSKWLIFVDSIKKGIKLRDEIQQEMKPKNNKNNEEDYSEDFSVAYIDADYAGYTEESGVVDEIVRKNRFSARVLIATSVMDNGINIIDKVLRNLVIMVDTETEFIQMLGRKRVDGQGVKLYILIRNQDHFIKRFNNLIRLKKIYKEYMEPFVENVERPLKQINYQMRQQDGDKQLVLGELTDKYNNIEKDIALKKHCEIMRKLADHELQYKDISKMFYVCKGTFLLNSLAVENLETTISYYEQMIEKFGPYDETVDDYAFVREQMRWLGKSDSEADAVIKDFIKSELEKAWNCVNGTLKNLVGKQMNSEENKEWKSKNREFCRSLFILMSELEVSNNVDVEDNSKIKTIKNIALKSSNSLSKPCMAFLRKYCNLPYDLEITGGVYTYRSVPIESEV